MKEQLRQKLGDEETNTLISNAVFSFSVGTNDYIAAAFPQSFVSRDEELVEIVIGNITDVIKEIYKEGGRKFAYVNVGPFDCAPPARARSPDGGCLEQLTAAFKLHNQKIPTVLQDLQSELHGFKYANFDFNKAFSERINNPSQYGFKEGKAACCEDRPYRGLGNCGKNNGTIRFYELCDNPNEYVFFDVHPTEKANEQFGELIWNGGVDYISPINFKKLFEA
ncbi:hypothetical protein JCGZ_24645 [Jatropha curcas]|uniref:Uncharacterized protein n=2 Tax=Jatropha curcas TaxID=180498 RepID=A0A067KWR1_JATCU|nr:hypothetical protein JCGZ_24645 [Jatropha curcas]